MKKLFILVGTIVLLSGCGSTKTLTCTTDNTVGTLTSNSTYTVDYMNNEVNKITVTYDYTDNYVSGTTDNTNSDNNNNGHTDGVGTGTDGTTEDEDTTTEENGVVGGVVGEALDDVVTGVADTVLDITGVKQMHNTRYNNYNTIEGFTRNIDTDDDNNYKITYTYDLTKMSDDDINTLGISKDLDTLKTTYNNRGLTCK